MFKSEQSLFSPSLTASMVFNVMSDTEITRADTVRFRVMRAIEANPQITQRELAEQIGTSVGSVNYSINALVDRGLVKVENFRASKTKWRYLYVLTPRGFAEKAASTHRFLQRHIEEYEALKLEIEALQMELEKSDIPAESYADGKVKRHIPGKS